MKVLEVLGNSRGCISWKLLPAIVSLTIVISCAANKGIGNNNPAELTSETVAASPTSQEAPPSESRILSSLEKDTLGLELVESAKTDQLIINADASPEDFSVSRISNPERVVIDIKTASATKLNKNYDASDTLYLNKVRVGSHPDKTRVVLDLPEGRDIQHAVEAQNNRLVIRLS